MSLFHALTLDSTFKLEITINNVLLRTHNVLYISNGEDILNCLHSFKKLVITNVGPISNTILLIIILLNTYLKFTFN